MFTAYSWLFIFGLIVLVLFFGIFYAIGGHAVTNGFIISVMGSFFITIGFINVLSTSLPNKDDTSQIIVRSDNILLLDNKYTLATDTNKNSDFNSFALNTVAKSKIDQVKVSKEHKFIVITSVEKSVELFDFFSYLHSKDYTLLYDITVDINPV